MCSEFCDGFVSISCGNLLEAMTLEAGCAHPSVLLTLMPGRAIFMKPQLLDSKLHLVHNELGPFRSGLQC